MFTIKSHCLHPSKHKHCENCSNANVNRSIAKLSQNLISFFIPIHWLVFQSVIKLQLRNFCRYILMFSKYLQKMYCQWNLYVTSFLSFHSQWHCIRRKSTETFMFNRKPTSSLYSIWAPTKIQSHKDIKIASKFI